jgi:hypothetical protein
MGWIKNILNRGFNSLLAAAEKHSPPASTFEAPKALAPKDPDDLSLCASSTRWEGVGFCPHCRSKLKSGELMNGICNACGTEFGSKYTSLLYRNIWDGERWMHQYRTRQWPSVNTVINQPWEKLKPR